jgi:heat shock protein HtpX
MISATGAVMLVLLALVVSLPIGLMLGIIWGLVSSAASKLLHFWNSHEFVPMDRGGRRVGDFDAPELVAIVGELAQRAAIPMPHVYVIESTETNAFAVGRDRRHAAICITTGLLHVLTRDELIGVLAHELAHVLNRTSLTKTASATLAAAASLLPPFGMVCGLDVRISLLLMFITPPSAFLVLLALARADEYAADRRGVLLTGRPDVVAGVLGRVELLELAGPGGLPNSATARVLDAIGKRLARQGRDNPFSAHPLPTNRISALARSSFPPNDG